MDDVIIIDSNESADVCDRARQINGLPERRRSLEEVQMARDVGFKLEQLKHEKPKHIAPRPWVEKPQKQKTNMNCKYYMKTGLCMFGEDCVNEHPEGVESTTLVLKNFFHHPDLKEGLFSDETRFDPKNLTDAYASFYRYVHEKFASIGKIVMFKCCCNAKEYLQGTLFVQYATREDALEAREKFHGETYGALRMNIRMVPITNWRSAMCGKTGSIHNEANCTFLHFLPNPNDAYPIVGERARVPVRSRANSVEDGRTCRDFDHERRSRRDDFDLIDRERRDPIGGRERHQESFDRHWEQILDRSSRHTDGHTSRSQYGSLEIWADEKRQHKTEREEKEDEQEYILHVTRIPKKVEENEIWKFFGAYDGVKDVQVPEAYSATQTLFSAFVVMKNRRLAEKILKHKHTMDGRELRLAGVNPNNGESSGSATEGNRSPGRKTSSHKSPPRSRRISSHKSPPRGISPHRRSPPRGISPHGRSPPRGISPHHNISSRNHRRSMSPSRKRRTSPHKSSSRSSRGSPSRRSHSRDSSSRSKRSRRRDDDDEKVAEIDGPNGLTLL